MRIVKKPLIFKIPWGTDSFCIISGKCGGMLPTAEFLCNIAVQIKNHLIKVPVCKNNFQSG